MKAYFDTVNHDKRMYFVEKQIADKRVLRLIRQYLLSGIMIAGIFEKSEEGTPQGGNLSPLLSNIYLNELDQLLESRGHRFVRYADDCNIYVKSRRAGYRVMKQHHQIPRREFESYRQSREKCCRQSAEAKVSRLLFIRHKERYQNSSAPQNEGDGEMET
jgi:retron-type reverse transcriptase